MRAKIVDIIPMDLAMENLSAIIGINLESPPPIGILQGKRIVTSQEELDSSQVRWISGEGAESLLQVLDLTYFSIEEHLRSLYSSKKVDMQSQKTRDGLLAIMAIVGESAPKMDGYLAYRFDELPKDLVEQRESFQRLKRFYVENVEGAFQQTPVAQKAISPGVSDQDYEFFSIVDEKGHFYFDDQHLRALKLSVDFNGQGKASFEEDPFLKIPAMLDRDFQASALQIITSCKGEIHQFYKVLPKVITFTMAGALNKAIMALYLTANPKHLLQRTSKKNTARYFRDFQLFLREALQTSEYQKWLAYPPQEHELKSLLELAWKLCYSLVERGGGIRQEAIGLLHRTIRKGEEAEKGEGSSKAKSVWEMFLRDDEHLRTLLEHFPQGPLLKILDVVRQGRDEGVPLPFDPWMQGNVPLHLYTWAPSKGKKVSVLHMAAPIRQGIINKVELIEEFRGFLFFLKSEKKKHLFIDLQDPLSWKEAARSQAIEECSKNKVFEDSFLLLRLPKHTEFYHQRGRYISMDKAQEFIGAFKNELERAEEHGFCFPKAWALSERKKWIDATLKGVHEEFFDSKPILNQRQREDFIEMVYQRIVMEVALLCKVDSLSFTCKDGVDIGALAAGMFYASSLFLQKGSLSREEMDLLRYICYFPALSVRERAPNSSRCIRAITMMDSLLPQQ